MLNKIRSVRHGLPFEMQLVNRFSSDLYRVDSINLIIGDNGSGKTSTIKGIIEDFLSRSTSDKFLVEGDTRNLGIIYYSGSPYHAEISSESRLHVHFRDASRALVRAGDFIQQAKDFLDAAKALGLERNLESIKRFDITEAVAECTRHAMDMISRRSIMKRSQQDVQAESFLLDHAELYEIHRRIRHVKDKFLRLERKKQRAEISSGEIRDIDSQLAMIAEERMYFDSKFIELSLERFGPQNRDQILLWLTYMTIENPRFSQVISRTLLGSRDHGSQHNHFPEQFRTRLQSINEFWKEIEHHGAGSVEFSRHKLTIFVQLQSLAAGTIDSKLIDFAHEIGLLGIEFGRSSSGEAAIFHQLISLSRTVRQLSEKGAQRFLIFIDEGDMLLHLDWQRRYLDLLDQRLGELKSLPSIVSIQIVVATHSPMLTSDVLHEAITRMGDSDRIPAFGAPIQVIINSAFKTKAVGAIAERVITGLRNKHLLTDHDLELVQQIDDEFSRAYVTGIFQRDY